MTHAFQCMILQSFEELHALADDWRRLEGMTRQPAPGFQTAAWNLAWIRALHNARQEGDEARREPFVLVVRRKRDDALVLLWPLMREHYPMRMVVYTWLSDPYGQYGDVLAAVQDEELQAAMQVALEELKNTGGDLVRLRHVREDAAAAPFLNRYFQASGDACAAPWLDLSAYASTDDLRQRFTRKQRRRRRKSLRQLQRYTGLEPTFRLMTDAREMHAAIDHMLECKRAWLKEKGLVSRALFSTQAHAFLHAVVDEMPPSPLAESDVPSVALSVMEAGERPLSWELGFRFRRRHYAWLTAHDLEFTRFSVGRLHMHMAQLQAFEDGVQAYDLLVPDAPHKETWSSARTPVHNYFLPLSIRGRLLGSAYLNHLRPFMRSMYHRLPPQVRRMLHLSELSDHDASMN